MVQRIVIRRWDEKEPNMDMKFRDGSGPNIETIYRELVVLVHEHTASLMYSERLHGISKNNKHWFKFSSPYKLFYSVKENVYNDKVGRFYYKEGRQFLNVSQDVANYFHKVTKNGIDGLDVFAMAVRDVASRNGVDLPLGLSITSKYFCYPILGNLNLPNGRTVCDRYSSSVTRHAATNDLGIFVQRAFGKTRYRKDLVKSVANLRSMPVFMLGYSFRGLVPIDWIITFYKKFHLKNPVSLSDTTFLYDHRKSLRVLSDKQVKKLFKILNDNKTMNNTPTYLIHDTLESIETIEECGHFDGLHDISFTTMKEAHDKLAVFARIATEIKRNAEIIQPLKYTREATAILREDIPEFSTRVIPAKTGMDLVEWGAQMGHCIGGYTRDAISGQGTYAGIYEDGKLIGNLELRDRKLTQIFGKNNKQLDPAILARVLNRLLNAKVIKIEELDYCYGLHHFKGTKHFADLKEQHAPKSNGTIRGRAIDDWRPVGYIENIQAQPPVNIIDNNNAVVRPHNYQRIDNPWVAQPQ